MNTWFEVKVKYTKQLENGAFKRISEPYLLAAMTFTDAEARIYTELGEIIRGEFTVTNIARKDFHDIFHYEDCDTWWKCKISYEGATEDSEKPKKVTQEFLVTAHTAKEATTRMLESLSTLMVDFEITSVLKSKIVDVFPYNEELDKEISRVPLRVPLNLNPGRSLTDIEARAVVEDYIIPAFTMDFPEDEQEVDVIFEDGSKGRLTFWSKEEGFDAQSEPYHLMVIGWKKIQKEDENNK